MTAPVLPLPPEEYEPLGLDVRDRRYPMPWEWWDAILIYFLFAATGFSVSIAAIQAFGDGELATAVGILGGTVALALATPVWVTFRAAAQQFPKPVGRVFGVARPTVGLALAGIGWGVVSLLAIQLGWGYAISLLIEATGQVVPEVQEAAREAVRAGGGTPILVALAVIVITPLGEEMLYRGVLYQALARHVHGWAAIGLSSLAFALAHGSLLEIVLLLPFGALQAWLLRRYGSLLVPIMAHATFNAAGFFLLRLTG